MLFNYPSNKGMGLFNPVKESKFDGSDKFHAHILLKGVRNSFWGKFKYFSIGECGNSFLPTSGSPLGCRCNASVRVSLPTKTMKPIICSNDVKTVLNHLQEYTVNGGIVKSVYLVDHTPEQVVILVADKDITKDMASIWWAGYVAALGDQS